MLKRKEDLIIHIENVIAAAHIDALNTDDRKEINDISNFLLKLFKIKEILEE